MSVAKSETLIIPVKMQEKADDPTNHTYSKERVSPSKKQAVSSKSFKPPSPLPSIEEFFTMSKDEMAVYVHSYSLSLPEPQKEVPFNEEETEKLLALLDNNNNDPVPS